MFVTVLQFVDKADGLRLFMLSDGVVIVKTPSCYGNRFSNEGVTTHLTAGSCLIKI